MKKQHTEQPIKTIYFKRADPEALSKFDPNTKRCTMNCGPHAQDPRTDKERKFLCNDCMTLTHNQEFPDDKIQAGKEALLLLELIKEWDIEQYKRNGKFTIPLYFRERIQKIST